MDKFVLQCLAFYQVCIVVKYYACNSSDFFVDTIQLIKMNASTFPFMWKISTNNVEIVELHTVIRSMKLERERERL